MKKRAKKETSFSPTQMMQFRNMLTGVLEQERIDTQKLGDGVLGNVNARAKTMARYPIKRIEEHEREELTAAIKVASDLLGSNLFWAVTHGIDAFFERRRRDRGYGFVTKHPGYGRH